MVALMGGLGGVPMVQMPGRTQSLCNMLAEARLAQRRVKGTVCRLLLVHQLVSAGLLDPVEGAKVVAHKGGRVKRKENK